MVKKNFTRPKSLYKEFTRKGGTATTANHYCPGCGHGIIHKLIAEAIDDFEIQDRSVLISPVGCAVFAYYYFNVGNVQAAHGRAPAVATGISRSRDDAVVISYQGDGDLASIGLNETIQAANRGEKMAVIFVNNTVYGMTGGQMAPTTLVGEQTVTCPDGRDTQQSGHPLHVCEILQTLKAPVFIERVSVSDIQHIKKARKAIRKALEIQRDGKGYAFVEIITVCPINLRFDAKQCTDWINEHMEKEFPLGVFRDNTEQAVPIKRPKSDYTLAALDKLYQHDTKGMEEPVYDPDYKAVALRASGFGGQGLLSMGLIMAQAGCKSLRYASWLPSYGPEQRGGTSNCSVIVSGQVIGSPAFNKSDVLVALNRPSLDKFIPEINEGGVVVYDSTIGDYEFPSHLKVFSVPALETAQELGASKSANVFMLGILASLDIYKIDKEVFRESIRDMFAGREKLTNENLQVFDHAASWAETNLIAVEH